MNTALWNVRKRHEWLRKPTVKARVKNRTKQRVCLDIAEARQRLKAKTGDDSDS